MANYEAQKDTVRLGIGSQTEAMKAKRLLSKVGNISVVKIENRIKDGGCLYGIKLDRSSLPFAVQILRAEGIYLSVITK